MTWIYHARRGRVVSFSSPPTIRRDFDEETVKKPLLGPGEAPFRAVPARPRPRDSRKSARLLECDASPYAGPIVTARGRSGPRPAGASILAPAGDLGRTPAR